MSDASPRSMIEATQLSQFYGPFVAIQDISFAIPEGQIVAFLGPNGAGKTTTMRILTGFLPPSDGTAEIAGHDIFEDPLAARRSIGYLPESPPLYPEMSVRSYLEFVARIKDVQSVDRRAAVDSALERCGLTEVRSRVIGTLSKGFRQRVGLAQAIVHDPAVIMLDEPLTGLDPRQRIHMVDLFHRLGDQGRCVIVSSHVLEEVERFGSNVLVIAKGRLAAQGDFHAIRELLDRLEEDE